MENKELALELVGRTTELDALIVQLKTEQEIIEVEIGLMEQMAKQLYKQRIRIEDLLDNYERVLETLK